MSDSTITAGSGRLHERLVPDLTPTTITTGLQPSSQRYVDVGPIELLPGDELTVISYSWIPLNPAENHQYAQWSNGIIGAEFPGAGVTLGADLGSTIFSPTPGNCFNTDPGQGTVTPDTGFALSNEVMKNESGFPEVRYLRCATNPAYGATESWQHSATITIGAKPEGTAFLRASVSRRMVL